MVEHALKITGIEELRDRFIDELSGGQRQMAHIAMSIAQDTKYILLDEPLNNLDMSRSVKIMKLLRKLAREESKTDYNSYTRHKFCVVLRRLHRGSEGRQNKIRGGGRGRNEAGNTERYLWNANRD